MRKKVMRKVMGVSTPNEGVSAINEEDSNEVIGKESFCP